MCPHCIAAGVSGLLLVGSTGFISQTLWRGRTLIRAALRTSERNTIGE